MPDLKKILTLGFLLGTTALASISPASSAPQTTQAAETPAPTLLQDPASPGVTALDQQAQIQSTADTSLETTPAPETAAGTAPVQAQAAPAVTANSVASAPQPSPVLAAPAQPQVQSPNTANLPTLSAVLEQAGIGEDEARTDENTAGSQPLPPGLDLPLNENLPEARQLTEEEQERELRQQAFGAASQGLMPMQTDEIRKLLQMYDETQQAVQTPIYPNPKPESTFETISLDPGTPPVEIKTAIGHVTTLSMVDASGQPWPIQDISWAGNFEVLQPESGSNMLRITPMADFAFGNVSMRMVGLNAPVILTLRTDRKSVQLRADVQIPEIGPKGVAPPIQRQITTTAGDTKLSTILEGVPPTSANKLKIDGIDGRSTAYELGGVTYLRTPYTLLSPAWDSSVRSADGTNVYAMRFTPVLLLSDKGKMVRAQLTRTEVSDE